MEKDLEEAELPQADEEAVVDYAAPKALSAVNAPGVEQLLHRLQGRPEYFF